ncbi:DUF1622 domain-containing protein [Aureispira anguillae]|uniref:DUF1622 domain-containing protein n=1 Tax=Aureispira anguillae TaxID=2864201 RepID=A0A915YIC5_9BACT|nr:DUF1622 domain-containing protein [Aureispira anguillae]BDS13552.1 DUF1622 domain-containing protein [Aureispira anguillae]
MRRSHPIFLVLLFLICFFPLLLVGQHVDPAVHQVEGHHDSLIFELLEWVEFIVDLVGIAILIVGFVKGILVFLKWELDNLRGGDIYDDILALRSTLGWYIILSLDFLIISDILHSVIKPEFNDLINLGIIVVLRTSIGYFLGRELMELRHAEQEDKRRHEAALQQEKTDLQ